MPIAIYIALIPILPLATFLLLGLFGKKYFNQSAGWIAITMLTLSTALAFYAAYEYFFRYGQVNGIYEKVVVFKYTWLEFSPGYSIDIGLLIDPITAMMLVVIPFISLMVHLYSSGYMKGDQRFATYYAFLGLFTFSMLGLVLSSNIFQLYIFWELVGVSSFLLIGFYYEKPSAVAACKKAFIVTRFADLGFLVGILILSYYAHSFDFVDIISRLAEPFTPEANAAIAAHFFGLSALSWAVLLIFIGAAGKSALFPLHIWLPDAMEGPTPVSALIHAATMVVAGIFLVGRLYHVFSMSQPILHMAEYVGVFSAVLAAVIACTQTDIKRVLAYSTMSQIGFMLLALGVSGASGGEHQAGFTGGMFHLFTHAMFKALLFLGAGAVIHYVHSNEMHEMGGLRKLLPVTHLTFLIACLAIAGIPPFAGFFSKEEILLAAWERNKPVFYVALFTSMLTAFYMFRLYFMIFWNKQTAVHTSHKGEGGWTMMLPLVILAAAACGTGFIPFGHFVTSNGRQLEMSINWQFSIAPVAMAIAGIGAAMWLYKNESNLPATITQRLGGLYRTALRKFYVDEVYVFITQKILFGMIGRSAAWFDSQVVDGMVNATGDGTAAVSESIRPLQSGKVQQYAIYFLLGVIIIAALLIYMNLPATNEAHAQ